MADRLVRLMGETDIVDIDPDSGGTASGASSVIPEELDAGDRINLLGHWLDLCEDELLAERPEYLDAMRHIAGEIMATHTGGAPGDNDTGKTAGKATGKDAGATAGKGGGKSANFYLVTILRERWPVGGRAKFFERTKRVGAKHTYVVYLCEPVQLNDLGDATVVKNTETFLLRRAMPHFRRHRKTFSASSAVQTLIRQPH